MTWELEFRGVNFRWGVIEDRIRILGGDGVLDKVCVELGKAHSVLGRINGDIIF